MNPEDLLTHTLHARADGADQSGTPLHRVRARAGELRSARRRRAVTVVGTAAAVAAVVVPSALWLTGTDDAAAPAGPVDSGPTSQAPFVNVLAGLRRGPRPGIDYLVGDTYVSASGGRTTMPALAKADTATPTRGGILTAPSPAPNMVFSLARLTLVTGSGAQFLGCGAPQLAVSTDQVQSAYWLSDSCSPGATGRLYDGSVSTMGESGPGYVSTPAGTAYLPVGILRDGVVVQSVGTGRHGPLLVAGDGSRRPLATLSSAAGSDENHDVVSGQLVTDPSTGAVVDSSGTVLWRAEGWRLGRFSLDGRYVVALPDPSVNAGTRARVFNAVTGTRVADLDPRLTHAPLAWDGDTLLAVVDQGQKQALVRSDLHGHLFLATRPSTSGYRLSSRP